MASTLNASLAVDAVLDYNLHRGHSARPLPGHQFYSRPAGNPITAQSVTSLNSVHRSQPHRHSHSHSRSHSHLQSQPHLNHLSNQNSLQNLHQPHHQNNSLNPQFQHPKQQNVNQNPQSFQNFQNPQKSFLQNSQSTQRLNNNGNVPQLSSQQRAASAKDLRVPQQGKVKTAQVICLDGQKLYFPVPTRLFAGDLFDTIASSFNLKEKEYFGLAYINETGTFSWLNLDKRVVEHEFPNAVKSPTKTAPEAESKETEVNSFEETQTLNRSSTRRIGELKRKNMALKSKKVTSSLTNLNSVQNKLKLKFNSGGMLGKLAKSQNILESSATAPNSQANSRQGSIASVNDMDLDPIYAEVPSDNPNENLAGNHQRSISYSNGLTGKDGHGFLGSDNHSIDDENEQQADIVLYFMVKYFVESIRLLSDTVTIQLFYLQAKSLVINEYIQVSPDVAPELGALILQITYGDSANFSLERTQNRIQKWRLISSQVDSLERSQIEKTIIETYGRLEGVSRGESIYRFMTLIEKEPTYGVHYFEALENKTRQLVWLGFSNKGILQFDYSERALPVRQFSWKHLENLYFRERKFSIEVRDAKRVVLALSSINLYENAIEEIDHLDDLSSAICDPTTQVSVSRRTFGPSNVTVYVWFATNCQLTKCMWSMAVAQHQFYTERHSQKCNLPSLRPEEDIIRALDGDKCLLVGSRANWKRKSLSSKSSSRPSHHPHLQNHYSSMCSVSSSRASSISGSLSNLSDSSFSSLDEAQTFSSDITTRMSRSFKSSDRSRNLISRRLKLLEMQLSEKLQEIDKLDRLENQLLRKAKSQTNLSQKPRLQDYLEVVSQLPHQRASISSTSSSGTSGTSGGPQTMIHIPTGRLAGSGKPLKSSNSISSTNSLRNFVVTGRSSVAGSIVSNNSAESAPQPSLAAAFPANKRLPPLPVQRNPSPQTLPPPPPPLPSANPPFVNQQVPNNVPPTKQPPRTAGNLRNFPIFSSPYVDRFEKSVQEGLNLYSVPNRRSSIAMNSFDDFFMKNSAPKFQSTASLEGSGNAFPGVSSSRSTTLTTDSNSVIYETVTYSSAGSNPGSTIGSRTNLSSVPTPSAFTPALVESSVDDHDECDSVSTSGKMSQDIETGSNFSLARSFFQNQSSANTFDEQNFNHYRSAFVDRVPFSSTGSFRAPEEYIGYSSRSSEVSASDCQIPIHNYSVPTKPEARLSKQYSGSFSQHQAKAPKGWVETNLDSGSVPAEPMKNELPLPPPPPPVSDARPLIVQSQKIATFMPQSIALQHVTHESDHLREPIESSVDDSRSEDMLENPYQQVPSHLTPSPSPPYQPVREQSPQVPLPPPPVPAHQYQHQLQQQLPLPPPPLPSTLPPPAPAPQTSLSSSQIQHSIPAYITNSEPNYGPSGRVTSQIYHPAAFSQSQKSSSPVQYHAAPVVVERAQAPPFQQFSSRPVLSQYHPLPVTTTASPASSSLPSPASSKRNSAALLSPTESVMSLASGPLSPPYTVAFVPAAINNEPVNTMANGNFSTNMASSIPVASCKGNIVEVDVLTVGQYQPGYEEEKPFTMDDFFKYSQKYRNSKAPTTGNGDKVNGQLSNQVGQMNLNRQQ